MPQASPRARAGWQVWVDGSPVTLQNWPAVQSTRRLHAGRGAQMSSWHQRLAQMMSVLSQPAPSAARPCRRSRQALGHHQPKLLQPWQRRPDAVFVEVGRVGYCRPLDRHVEARRRPRLVGRPEHRGRDVAPGVDVLGRPRGSVAQGRCRPTDDEQFGRRVEPLIEAADKLQELVPGVAPPHNPPLLHGLPEHPLERVEPHVHAEVPSPRHGRRLLLGQAALQA
jgi:hypothetical protein